MKGREKLSNSERYRSEQIPCWNQAYISFGSNMGDRLFYIYRALEQIGLQEGVQVIRCSPFYESIPLGKAEVESSELYINGVIKVQTLLEPLDLLHCLLQIEIDNGRERIEKWGARTLDLDLLLYAETVISTHELIVPHPRMMERDFVVVPLLDIEPTLRLPSGDTLKDAVKKHDFGKQLKIVGRIDGKSRLSMDVQA